MNRLVGGNKANPTAGHDVGNGKRKAEGAQQDPVVKKRSALGDLTNAGTKKRGNSSKDKVEKATVKIYELPKIQTRSRTRSQEDNKPVLSTKPGKKNKVLGPTAVETEKEKRSGNSSKLPVRQTRSSKSRSRDENVENKGKKVSAAAGKPPPQTKHQDKQKYERISDASTVSLSDNESLYTTAISSPSVTVDPEVENRINEEAAQRQKPVIPEGVEDYDASVGNELLHVGNYVADIFAYYRRRENRFIVSKYLDNSDQHGINRNMRAILIDWMIEVQESFELNHETLYLAVKLVDFYLTKQTVDREKLQLIGATALFIAAKYDERCPPVIDDFCYICDDAYTQREIIKMEVKMLKTLNFDIGMPLSYRFLRRYSRCAGLGMKPLTLARYILESSLMEYDFIDVKDSMISAAALLLALLVLNVENPWSKTLEYYSGYTKEDIYDLTHRLHVFMMNIPSHLKTIRAKYSHKVFFEVAKIPIPDEIFI